jgi:hypothetical protein
VVDNNLFLSPTALLDMSEGGAYVHNLISGGITRRPELGRETPYHPAHSTQVAGLVNIQGGDDRFFNNIFVGKGKTEAAGRTQWASGFGLSVYDSSAFPARTGGNVFLNGARPYAGENDSVDSPRVDPGLKLVDGPDGVFLHMRWDDAIEAAKTTLVTTETLGTAKVPGLPYEDVDGSPLTIDVDFFGTKRDAAHPTPGPFERPGRGALRLKVR